MPKHFENICSAIDQLPTDLNFDVPPLAHDLGTLVQQPDASGASLPDEGGSQCQSSNAGQQQAVTPGTSFSKPKRRKGYGAGRAVMCCVGGLTIAR